MTYTFSPDGEGYRATFTGELSVEELLEVRAVALAERPEGHAHAIIDLRAAHFPAGRTVPDGEASLERLHVIARALNHEVRPGKLAVVGSEAVFGQWLRALDEMLELLVHRTTEALPPIARFDPITEAEVWVGEPR